MAVADGSVHDAAVVSRAIARTNPGEQLDWRTARPELVDQPSRFALRRSAVASAKAEGRACSWFDTLTTSVSNYARLSPFLSSVAARFSSARVVGFDSQTRATRRPSSAVT